MNTPHRHRPYLSRFRSRPRWLASVAVVVAAVSLGACGGDSGESKAVSAPAALSVAEAPAMTMAAAAEAPAATEAAAPAEEFAAEAEIADVDMASAGMSAGEVQAAAPLDVPAGESPVFVGRDIIFTGTLTLTTPDIEAAVKQVTRIVDEAGGGVFSSNVVLGEEGHGTMTVKLPPRAINATINALDAVGDVSGFTQDAQDVTAQMIDLDARILTAAASVDRARVFLEQATTISDLAQLENELTNRETSLEQLRAQQRSLSDQVSSATLTIELVLPPPVAVVEPEPITVPSNFVKVKQATVSEAFSAGLHAFGTAAKFVGVVLAVSAPFVATLAVVVVPLLMLGRRRGRRRRAIALASAPSAI